MPISWTAEAETKLLLGILDQFKGAKIDYKALAAYMGPGCTVSALHQHMFKLRREAVAAGANLGKPAGRSPSTPSPSKRSKGPLSPKSSSPITKAKKADNVSEVDTEDDGSGKCNLALIKEEDDKDDKDEKKACVDLMD
ncbi:hypothetical protein BJX64DRAFT_163324 [Aspergillus heterothallicus]